jgi:hypothetical protein
MRHPAVTILVAQGRTVRADERASVCPRLR